MDVKIDSRKIKLNDTLYHALSQMDDHFYKLLLVVDDNDNFKGLLSLGDIQRAILRKYELTTEVNKILRKTFLVASIDDSIDNIKSNMLKYRMEFMPVIENNKIHNIYLWEELFEPEIDNYENLDLPVVIMAGGIGSRMKPLTNVIPKPLIPVNDKAIIHEIIDKFRKFNCHKFIISVNYKYEMIKQYFKDVEINSEIVFIKEDQFTGTAGSLKLLKDHIETESFFISNCDIIVNQDYSEIYDYHKKNNNDLTIVSAMKHYYIPYGVIETSNNGILKKINEKPQTHIQVNTGMYLLKTKLIDYIPENSIFHMTDLINIIDENNGKIGVFPVSEKSWSDIGEWDEYLSTISKNDFKKIKN